MAHVRNVREKQWELGVGGFSRLQGIPECCSIARACVLGFGLNVDFRIVQQCDNVHFNGGQNGLSFHVAREFLEFVTFFEPRENIIRNGPNGAAHSVVEHAHIDLVSHEARIECFFYCAGKAHL